MARRSPQASIARVGNAIWRAGAVVIAPLRRLFAHVSVVGWVVAALSLVGIFLGRKFGWDELVVGGVALAIVLVVSTIMTLGRSTYAVNLDLADHRVVVGERAIGRLTVTNVGRGRLLPVRIELPVGAGSADVELPSMAPGAKHEEVFAVAAVRRAVITVGPVRSVRGDALGLMRRQVRWTEPDYLYIHPLTVSLATARTGLLRDLEGNATRVISDNDMSFHALREYVPGDDRRSIHWKSTARFGELMVRQFEDTRRTHTALAIVEAALAYLDEEEYEFAIRAYASIGQQAIREGLEITALNGGQTLRSQTPPWFLDDCAGITSRVIDPGEHVITQHIARHAPDASLAMVLTGSTTPEALLRTWSGHVPAGVRTVFVSCEQGAELGLRTQGRLSLATLGDIGDLPRLLSRLVTG